MIATDSLIEDIPPNPQISSECPDGASQVSESSSDAGSEISLSEKIVLESNEKRLRKRIDNLQTTIVDLREQLKQEKELWKEDMEKIREIQKQQQEMRCACQLHPVKSRDALKTETASRSSSVYNLVGAGEDKGLVSKKQSIKQLLEFQNYKRKLVETENMCSLELLRVKQSLEDLKSLQNIALEWGRDEKEDVKSGRVEEGEKIQEIYLSNTVT